MALKFVLVASTISNPDFHRALVIVTLSVAGVAPGNTVIVVVRVMANHATEIVTILAVVTAEVLTGNATLDAPPFTVLSEGTRTTVGSLLDGGTSAPGVISPGNPAVAAWFTARLGGRGVLSRAALMLTISSGAAALVVMVKLADNAPAGITTV